MKNRNYEGNQELDDFREEFNSLDLLGVFYIGSGGGDPPSETKTTSITEPPEYVKPYSIEMMERAGDLSNKPYEYYSGQRIAGLEPEHYYGLDNTSQRAMEGSASVNQAKDSLGNTLNNNYMQQGMNIAGQTNPMTGQANAYEGQSNPFIDQQNSMIGQQNQFMGQSNPYSGQNPYMENMIDSAQQGITDNYNDVINPQLQAQDRASGAFGNTGAQATRDKSQEQLLSQLSDTENQMRFQDYGQQAQLAESGLARNAGIAESGLGRDASLMESGIGRGAELYQNDLGRNAQLNEQGINRDAGLYGQQQNNMLNTFGNERNNQMGGIGQAGGLAEQDYIDAQNLLGVGDIYRGVNQQNLDFGYDQWQQQQNYPYQQLDLLSNAVRTSMGGGGTNVTSAPNAYAPNSTAQQIGTGIAGYGALQGLLG